MFFLANKSNAEDRWRKLLGTHQVDSIDELHDLANRVAPELAAGDILLLSGELGSGKTTFTQCLAAELGVGDRVTSPTFTLEAEYDLPRGHVANQLVHVDLYRWADRRPGAEDLLHLQELLDTAERYKRIVVIEWAEKMGDILPKKAWQIAFRYGDRSHRRVVEVTRRHEQ